MDSLARIGVGLAAIAVCFGATQAVATSGGAGGQPIPKGNGASADAKLVPEFTPEDTARSARALGVTPGKSSGMAKNLAPDLQIPEGATSMQEGLWHYGPRKWGTVRVLQYAKPIDIAPRNWRQARTYIGKGDPSFLTDRFGVTGLKELSVYVGINGKVVAVMPTDYTGFTQVKMAPNLANTKEVGD